MDALRERAERRLQCDIYQAWLHCTPDERVQLVKVIDAWKTGLIPLQATQEAVSALRRQTA